MPKTKSLEILHQNTNTDSNTSLHEILTDLSGGAQGAYLLKKSDKDFDVAWSTELTNDLTSDIYTHIDTRIEEVLTDTEASLRKIETLEANFKTANALAEEETLVRATADEALAKKINKLKASVGDNSASITEEKFARASADEAIASSVTTLEANLNGDIASVQTYAEALATTKNRTYRQNDAPSSGMIAGDLWFDTDDSNKAYRYDGVSWVATDDTRVATTYARWGVQVDAGGNVAGIQLNSSNAGSSNFVVLADNFKVYRAGYTSDPIFSTGTVNGVATVGIKGDLVIDGSIVTNGVANNAINRPVTSSIGATTVSTTDTAYISVTLTTSVPCTIFASSSTGMSFPAGVTDSRFVLRINGNAVATMHTGSAYVQSIALSGALAVSAGTHTITFTGWNSGSYPPVEIESGTLYAVGIQK